MSVESYDLGPENPYVALTAHFMKCAPPSMCSDIEACLAFARGAASEMQLRLSMLKMSGGMEEQNRSTRFMRIAGALLDEFFEYPAPERDTLLIANARVFAVVDPVTGNELSDEMLRCLAVSMSNRHPEVESIGAIIGAIMDEGTRLAVAAETL